MVGNIIATSGGFRGGSEVSMEPPFLAKSKIDRYRSRLVLDFMEPSLPSSYKKTLALAYLRVILNEYWSIGKPWARSSTMQRIRSCASFISRRGQCANGRGSEIFARAMRAFFNRTLLWLILDPPLATTFLVGVLPSDKYTTQSWFDEELYTCMYTNSMIYTS